MPVFPGLEKHQMVLRHLKSCLIPPSTCTQTLWPARWLFLCRHAVRLHRHGDPKTLWLWCEGSKASAHPCLQGSSNRDKAPHPSLNGNADKCSSSGAAS